MQGWLHWETQCHPAWWRKVVAIHIKTKLWLWRKLHLWQLGKKTQKNPTTQKQVQNSKFKKKKKKEFILQKCLNSWWIHLHGRSNGDLGVFPMEEIGRTFPCVGKSNSCGMHLGWHSIGISTQIGSPLQGGSSLLCLFLLLLHSMHCCSTYTAQKLFKILIHIWENITHKELIWTKISHQNLLKHKIWCINILRNVKYWNLLIFINKIYM